MAKERPLIVAALLVGVLGWVGFFRHAVSSRTVWFVDGSDRAYNIVVDNSAPFCWLPSPCRGSSSSTPMAAPS